MRGPERMLVYNLFPLLAGRFTEWERHLQRASGMGFNWLFLNPIQRPGMSGSLYSISDYFDFNPLLVDPGNDKPSGEQVRAVLMSAEKLGLKVMVDLVANHSAVDSDLIKRHPEWFKWKPGGRVDHPFAFEGKKKVVWGDLAKIDHENTRDKEGLFRFFFQRGGVSCGTGV
jgi:starch synthase (maltosyl-transferring)